jgi:hypothetical protein
MAYSFSGVAYASLFLAMGLLSYRFFQYWRKRKDITSCLLFYIVFSYCIFAFYKSMAGLFFANNAAVLLSSTLFALLIETITAGMSIYLIFFHFKFPKIVSRVACSVALALGLVLIYLTVLYPPGPFVEADGSINWGLNPDYSGLRTILLLMTFVPLAVILIRQYKNAEDRFIKDRSIGLASLTIMGVVIGSIDFFLIGVMHMSAFARDVAISVLGIFLTLFIYLTQKPPQPELVDNKIKSIK